MNTDKNQWWREALLQQYAYATYRLWANARPDIFYNLFLQDDVTLLMRRYTCDNKFRVKAWIWVIGFQGWQITSACWRMLRAAQHAD